MTSTLLTGIGELVTNDGTTPDRLGIVRDAAVVVQDGLVAWVGRRRNAPTADLRTDLGGRAVVPGFVDSHAHLVFAGDRAAEFEARMAGTPYDGGGIASTVAATRAATDGELREHLRRLVAEMRAQGTTTVEVKSGYGLTVEDEVRSLRLAREVTDEVTFLGAHVVPAEYAGRADDYVALVAGPMLTACAPRARWVDVFCEPGSAHAFDGDQARAVLEAGRRGRARAARARQPARRRPRRAAGGGARQPRASTTAPTSSPADVDALAQGTTVATLLPTVEFSTRSPYPDARRLLDAGATVALATDCNPGSGYSSSMPLAIALAVREMRMTPAEALWSATAGGAAALRRSDVGVVRTGARADLAVLDAPSYLHLAYRPGVPLARALDL